MTSYTKRKRRPTVVRAAHTSTGIDRRTWTAALDEGPIVGGGGRGQSVALPRETFDFRHDIPERFWSGTSLRHGWPLSSNGPDDVFFFCFLKPAVAHVIVAPKVASRNRMLCDDVAGATVSRLEPV